MQWIMCSGPLMFELFYMLYIEQSVSSVRVPLLVV